MVWAIKHLHISLYPSFLIRLFSDRGKTFILEGWEIQKVGNARTQSYLAIWEHEPDVQQPWTPATEGQISPPMARLSVTVSISSFHMSPFSYIIFSNILIFYPVLHLPKLQLLMVSARSYLGLHMTVIGWLWPFLLTLASASANWYLVCVLIQIPAKEMLIDPDPCFIPRTCQSWSH